MLILGTMRWLRVVGTAIIVLGIAFGIVTFYLFSYGLITPTTVEVYWFWQGPLLGAGVAVVGAALVLHPRNRRTRRAIP